MKKRGRITLGLFNTYDRLRLTEAHRRAIARVGPLAYAYEMNIALFQFPFEKNFVDRDLSRWIRDTSSIGEFGELITLVESGDRITIVDEVKNGFPPQLGKVVITTCKPEASKQVLLTDVCEFSKKGHSVLLLFGLGPKGLPKKVKQMGQMHLDVTPDGSSLETCTALGAVAASIYHLGR